jgi:branched-chain amino acid transport system permease protein
MRPGNYQKIKLVSFVAGGLIFLLLPILINNEYLRHLGILAMLFSVVASSWDLTLGYAGLFNFAHIAFFGLGAYTSGILSVRYGISPWLGILAGTGVAVLSSAVISIPAIRLRGIYIALLTFAFSQLVLLIILSQHELTGGQQGLVGVPGLSIGNFQFRESRVAYFYLCGALLLVSTIFLRRLVKSNFGISLIALRDFEEFAISRGVPLAQQRFMAFIYSAIFTGAAGAIFAHYLIVASPEFFGFSFSTLFMSMILVGGTATIYGSIIAGVVLTFISELLAPLGPVRFMVVAVIIIVTIRFSPKGVWGLVSRMMTKPAPLLEYPSEEGNSVPSENQEASLMTKPMNPPPSALGR